MIETKDQNEAACGWSALTAELDIETFKLRLRPCGLPYGVMCNCFRCLRQRMRAAKEYAAMPKSKE